MSSFDTLRIGPSNSRSSRAYQHQTTRPTSPQPDALSSHTTPYAHPHTHYGRLSPPHPYAPGIRRARAAHTHFRRHACFPRPEEPAHSQVNPEGNLPDQRCPSHSPASPSGHPRRCQRPRAHSHTPPRPRQLPLELREVRQEFLEELDVEWDCITNNKQGCLHCACSSDRHSFRRRCRTASG